MTKGDVAVVKPALRVPPILLEGDEPGAPPVSGLGQKYALGLTAPAGHFGPEEGKLPTAYGTQKLRLTARDPHSLYAHWDLTDEQQRRFNAQSAHHHLVVRLHAETTTAEPVTEVHVHPESRHWFIYVPRASTAYVAQLGYYQPNRQWAVIATSAATITPPDTISADKTAQFGTMSAEGPSPPLAASARTGAQERQLPAAVRQFTLGEPTEAIQTRELRPETLQNVHALQGLELVRGAVEQEIQVMGGRQIWLPAQIIAAMGISSPAGEEMEIVSSPSGQEPPRERGFWFNVNAELILYGATEPGATGRGRSISRRRLAPGGVEFQPPHRLPRRSWPEAARPGSAKNDDARMTDDQELLGRLGLPWVSIRAWSFFGDSSFGLGS